MLDARMNELSLLRESGELSDISVIVDKTEFRLHKFPLYLNSDFFRGLCRCGMIDEDQVTLTEFPGGASTFSLIADYCYGKEISIDYTNVAELRCAAEFLQMITPGNLTSETSMALGRILRTAPRRSALEVAHVLSSCCRLGEIASQTHVISSCFSAVLEIWHSDGTLPELILQVIKDLPVAWFVGFIVVARDSGKIPVQSMTTVVSKYLETLAKERRTAIDDYLRSASNGVEVSCGEEGALNIGEIIEVVLLELPDDAPLDQIMDAGLICLLYQLATISHSKCEVTLLRAVSKVLNEVPMETIATMTRANLTAIAEYTIHNNVVQPRTLCETLDSFLWMRVKHQAIDVDEFRAVSRILPKGYREQHDSLLRISEELFATKKLSDETKLEILSAVDPRRLHEDTLRKASERNLVPSCFIVESALAVSSRLRNELTAARSELENKNKAIDEVHLSVADVIKGQWESNDVTVNVTPKNVDNTRVQFAKVLARNSSTALCMQHEEFEGKLTLCVRRSRGTPTQDWFLFDPFNEQLIEMKLSKYNTLMVGENYQRKKHTTPYWPFNDVS